MKLLLLCIVLSTNITLAQTFNYAEYNFRFFWGLQNNDNKALMKTNKVKVLYEYERVRNESGKPGKDSTLVSFLKFDSNGNLTEEYWLTNNKKTNSMDTFKLVYKYDKHNNVIYKKGSASSDGSSHTEQHKNSYDKQGRLSMHIAEANNHYPDTFKYYYNKQGLVSEIYRPYTMWCWYYSYQNGVLVKEQQIRKGCGGSETTQTYNYNAAKTEMTKITLATHSYKDEMTTETRTYKLDKLGRIIEEYLSYRPEKAHASYSYSANGLMLYRKWMNSEYIYRYEFR